MLTLKEIENQVRTKLLDTHESGYRFSPSEIFHAVRDGVRVVRSIRPEARYVDGVLTETGLVAGSSVIEFYVPDDFPTEIGGVAYTLEDYRGLGVNIGEKWREALVYYVIHAMYLKDDADTANAALSQSYYGKFMTTVMM